jgi:hypothetical protein
MSDEQEKLFYHYILVRQDLPIPVQMVNVAHAAGESVVEAPIPPTTRAVVLHVADEAQLLEYAAEVQQKGLSHVLIREPDAPYNGAAMALGLAPSQRRNALRRTFYHLELVK